MVDQVGTLTTDSAAPAVCRFPTRAQLYVRDRADTKGRVHQSCICQPLALGTCASGRRATQQQHDICNEPKPHGAIERLYSDCFQQCLQDALSL